MSDKIIKSPHRRPAAPKSSTSKKTPMTDAARYVMDLEQTYRLFEKQIEGVYFWKLIRFSLAGQIETKRGTLQPAPDRRVEKTVWHRLMRYIRSFDHCFTDPRVILYEHSRKVKYGNDFIDPYSWGVTRTLEKSGADFCLLENDLYYQCNLLNPRRWFLTSDQMNRVPFEKLTALPGEIAALVRQLEQCIVADLGLEVDLTALIFLLVNKFKKDYSYFAHNLHDKTTEVLFIVCGYGKEGVVQAAKDAGIYTVELQHGTIYPLHLGYAYPNLKRIPYFADAIALFADNWLNEVPLEGVDSRVIGYAPVSTERRLTTDRKKSIDLLFISQWTHSEAILQIADETARLMPTRKVVCKLHPSDADPDELRRRYPHIAIEKDGILGAYLSDAVYVATVYSTGIYESLRYNCLPILLDLYGVQHMEGFVRVTGAPIVSDGAQLARLIEGGGRTKEAYRNLSCNQWFAEFDESAVLDFVYRGRRDAGA